MDYTISNIEKIPQDLKKEFLKTNLDSAILAGDITKYFQYGIIFTTVIFYPVFPYLYSKDNYFRRKGFANVVLEYQIIKKLFYILLFPFILTFLGFLFRSANLFNFTIPFIPDTYVVYILITVTIMGSGALLKTFLFFLRKVFRYSFAKGCSELIDSTRDEIQELEYTSMMLNSYNKYLKRSLRVEIKDIDKIFTIMLKDRLHSDKEKSHNPIIMSKLFEGSSLDLLQYLSNTYYKSLNLDNFLAKEPFRRWLLGKVKLFGSFLVVAIPIVISIIEVISKLQLQ